jgi:hypothetical protein
VVTAKPLRCSAQDGVSAVRAPLPQQVQPANLIEIVLPAGTTLRVDAQVDPRALRRILAVLRG